MLQTSSPSIAVNFTIDMLKIQTKWKLLSSMEQISTWYTSCAKWLMTWPPTYTQKLNKHQLSWLIFYFLLSNDIITLCLWLYGSWIYNNICNQYLSPLMLRVRISIRTRRTTLCDKVCQWLPTEILLKVELNTIKQTNKQQQKCHKFAYMY